MAPLPRPLRLLTHLAVSCGLMALWLPPQTVPPLFVALALVPLWPALALPQPVPWRGWRLSWDVITAFVLVPAVALWLAAPAHGMTALTVLIVVMELRWAHNPGRPPTGSGRPPPGAPSRRRTRSGRGGPWSPTPR